MVVPLERAHVAEAMGWNRRGFVLNEKTLAPLPGEGFLRWCVPLAFRQRHHHCSFEFRAENEPVFPIPVRQFITQ